MPTPPITSFSGPYRFLSNFFPCQIKMQGITYPSIENAFQAAKTTTPTLRVPFETCRPDQAKAKGGRRGHLLLRRDWESIKENVMLRMLRMKFAYATPLGNKLMATGDAALLEHNYWSDTEYGICARTGVGQNILGQLLMQVRAELNARSHREFVRLETALLPHRQAVRAHQEARFEGETPHEREARLELEAECASERQVEQAYDTPPWR